MYNAGPVTTIGTLMPRSTIELTVCDPLAEEYNTMLRSIGLEERANIQKVAGEDLSQVFEKNSFDLDHAYDPQISRQF